MFRQLKEDIQCIKDRDPAAASIPEILLLYPGLRAVRSHRKANWCYRHNLHFLARWLSQRCVRRTGIEIHPGATIGKRFFIDHGTGIVIGETTIIGKRVKIYQNVTLGALSPRKGQSLAGKKRHPTVEDDVTIYSGASILGGDTVIGKGSVIGSNVFITESIAPGTSVRNKKQELQFKNR